MEYVFSNGVGKRKSSIARVTLVRDMSGKKKGGSVTINNLTDEEHLQNNPRTLEIVRSPMELVGFEDYYENYFIIVFVSGGGLSGQAEAIRLGISRALRKIVDSEKIKKLKVNGFLTRNSLCKERRKYGLKKARKAPQFSKR